MFIAQKTQSEAVYIASDTIICHRTLLEFGYVHCMMYRPLISTISSVCNNSTLKTGQLHSLLILTDLVGHKSWQYITTANKHPCKCNLERLLNIPLPSHHLSSSLFASPPVQILQLLYTSAASSFIFFSYVYIEYKNVYNDAKRKVRSKRKPEITIALRILISLLH